MKQFVPVIIAFIGGGAWGYFCTQTFDQPDALVLAFTGAIGIGFLVPFVLYLFGWYD